MTNDQIIYAVAGAAGLVSIVVWVALVLVPAWSAYSRVWERLLATLLSIYVLAAMVLVGAGLGAAILWYWGDV